MKRDPLGVLLVVLLIGGLGVVGWATRHPESPLLARAEEWPVVGPLVERFRAHYIPLASSPGDELDGGRTGKDGADSGAWSTTHLSDPESLDRDFIWLRPGTGLHRAADSRSPLVEVVPAAARLAVLGRDDDWYQVMGSRQMAWAHLPNYGRDGEPPLGSEPAAPKPLPGRSPDPDLLAQATGLLQSLAEPATLSGYEFFTDLEDDQLAHVLGGVADNIERAYTQRYGVAPIDKPREAVVLFGREHDYRSFQNTLERLAGLPAVGLVSRGVVAVYVGQRDHKEVAATLIHELVHLLNRRALGPALPLWLDEGLADDLSYSGIRESGELAPDELAGSTVDLGSVVIWKGGRAAALELKRALIADRAVPLETLLSLEWREFVDPEMRLHYPQSALFVRYLIDSEPALRTGFHAYLKGIAEGESVAPAVLLDATGRTWDQLETGFRDWALERFVNIPEKQRAAGSDSS